MSAHWNGVPHVQDRNPTWLVISFPRCPQYIPHDVPIYPPWFPGFPQYIMYRAPMAPWSPSNAVQRFSKQTGAWPLTFRNSFFAGWVDGWAPKIYKKKPWNLTWNLYMSSMDLPFPILSNMGFLRIALGYTSNSDKSRDVFPTRSA